jgi:predicted membrane metal-binding protein
MKRDKGCPTKVKFNTNRKKMKKIILSILFLFCSYFQLLKRKKLKAVLEKQRLDWNNGDMIGYMQGYIKSDSLVFVGKTGPFYGWQKNLEIYQQVYPTKPLWVL